MRIRMNDERERLYENLVETSPHGTKSGALDDAVRFYLRMVGGNGVNPSAGNVEELMNFAADNGNATAEEIAGCLDTPELNVSASTEFSVELDNDN